MTGKTTRNQYGSTDDGIKDMNEKERETLTTLTKEKREKKKKNSKTKSHTLVRTKH